MKRTYTHVSDMKRELILKGWIRRLGRNAVELLVGVFPPPKIRALTDARSSESSEDEVRKIPNLENQSSESSEDEVRNFPNFSPLPPDPPIRIEPVVDEPVAAATAAAAHPQAWKKETADEAYVSMVKAGGLYRQELVDYVWRKLKFTCAQEQVQPTKGRLMFWLSTERGAPVQPLLPEMGAPVVEASFAGPEPARSKAVRPPDPECHLCGGTGENEEGECPCTFCTHCSGSGIEIIQGKGARKCRCLLPPAQPPPMSAEELAEEQRQFEEAQKELLRAGG